MSSTSDGAPTQTKFNRLLQNEIGDNTDLVENKCSIHLGVNLRHACVKAVNSATIVQENSKESSDIPDSESEIIVPRSNESSDIPDSESERTVLTLLMLTMIPDSKTPICCQR